MLGCGMILRSVSIVTGQSKRNNTTNHNRHTYFFGTRVNTARKINTAKMTQDAVILKFTKSKNIFCNANSVSQVIGYPSLWLSIIAFNASASSSDNVSLPRKAAINPGSDPPKVRFTNCRLSPCCISSLGIREVTMESSF